MTSTMTNNQECCPAFIPETWHDKKHEWADKRFIKEKVFTLFYMPLGFGKTMVKLDNLVSRAGGSMSGWLCLSEHTSMWNMNLFLAVDKEITDAENLTMGGSFFSMVYEGPFKNSGKWSKNFENVLKERELKSRRIFFWYTTCPKCAKKHGKNYVVLFAELL